MKTGQPLFDTLAGRILIGTSIPLLLLILSLPLAAQTESSAADFKALMNRSNKLTAGVPCRERMLVEFSDSPDGPWEFYSDQFTETAAGRTRNVQLWGARMEYIYIGDTIYSRQGDGEWSEHPRTKPPSIQTVWNLEPPKTEYRESVPAKGGGVTMEITSTGGSAKLITGQVVDRSGRIRSWFDADGRLIKTEEISYNGPRKNFNRHTFVYEYDPAITIAAPIKP